MMTNLYEVQIEKFEHRIKKLRQAMLPLMTCGCEGVSILRKALSADDQMAEGGMTEELRKGKNESE